MRLPGHISAIEGIDLIVRAEKTSSHITEHEEESIHARIEDHHEDIFDRDLLYQIETILAEDAMVHVIAIICMGYALKPVLNGCLKGHVEWEEDAPVRKGIAETLKEKEVDADQLGCHCTPNQFSKNGFSPAMRKGSVPEE